MEVKRFEVAVIGGGPAGSAIAVLLARSGKTVALLEKKKFPRDKVCGEFLSPESQRFLETIGCLGDIIAAEASEIHVARFTSSHGKKLEVRLPETALGISRKKLDWIIWNQALSVGAVCFDQAEVKEVNQNVLTVTCGETSMRLQAPLTIGAYGKRSALDQRLARPFMKKHHPYVGLKRHHRACKNVYGEQLARELDGAVEIHLFDGGYCGMSFVEDGKINISMLLTPRAIRRILSIKWKRVVEYLCEQNPFLKKRLTAMEAAGDEMLAEAQLPFSIKEAYKEGMFFIGDAVSMIPPFCGDGIAMALRSAEMLERCIRDSSSEADLARTWERSWKAEFGFRIRLGNLLQAVLLSPGMSHLAIRLLEKAPFLSHWIVKKTRGA